MNPTPTLAEHLRDDMRCLTLFKGMQCAVDAPAVDENEMIIIHTLNHAYGTDGAALLAKYLNDQALSRSVSPNPRIKKEAYAQFAARILRSNLLLPRKTSLQLLTSANIPQQ